MRIDIRQRRKSHGSMVKVEKSKSDWPKKFLAWGKSFWLGLKKGTLIVFGWSLVGLKWLGMKLKSIDWSRLTKFKLKTKAETGNASQATNFRPRESKGGQLIEKGGGWLERMKKVGGGFLQLVVAHKKVSTVALVVLALGAFAIFRNPEQPEKIVVENEETVEPSEDSEYSGQDFYLSIKTDDLEIDTPVVNGVTMEKLAQGAGKHKTTAFPNGVDGNTVISAHRWYPGKNPNYTLFEDLDKLKIGDKVSLFYRGQKFVYEVFEEKTVGPREVSILDQTKEPRLTLYTCTPKYTSAKRLVYVAKLVN